MSAKSRLFSLLGALVLVATLACADSATAPSPTGAKAPRDTSTGFIPGDTLDCRSGWEIQGGRVVCL
jgi:hypothetical protein